MVVYLGQLVAERFNAERVSSAVAEIYHEEMKYKNSLLFLLGTEEVVSEEGAQANDVAGQEAEGDNDEGCKQDWKREQPGGNGC